jgi:hypothetical protein
MKMVVAKGLSLDRANAKPLRACAARTSNNRAIRPNRHHRPPQLAASFMSGFTHSPGCIGLRLDSASLTAGARSGVYENSASAASEIQIAALGSKISNEDLKLPATTGVPCFYGLHKTVDCYKFWLAQRGYFITKKFRIENEGR